MSGRSQDDECEPLLGSCIQQEDEVGILPCSQFLAARQQLRQRVAAEQTRYIDCALCAFAEIGNANDVPLMRGMFGSPPKGFPEYQSSGVCDGFHFEMEEYVADIFMEFVAPNLEARGYSVEYNRKTDEFYLHVNQIKPAKYNVNLRLPQCMSHVWSQNHVHFQNTAKTARGEKINGIARFFCVTYLLSTQRHTQSASTQTHDQMEHVKMQQFRCCVTLSPL
jgi:hypothetical protein